MGITDRDVFTKDPLVPPAFAFGLGIALGAWLPAFHPGWSLALCLAALTAWQIAARRGIRGGNAAALLFFLSLGLYRFQGEGHLLSGDPVAPAAGDVTAEGRVTAATEVRDDTLLFEIEDVRLKIGGETRPIPSRSRSSSGTSGSASGPGRSPPEGTDLSPAGRPEPLLVSPARRSRASTSLRQAHRLLTGLGAAPGRGEVPQPPAGGGKPP